MNHNATKFSVFSSNLRLGAFDILNKRQQVRHTFVYTHTHPHQCFSTLGLGPHIWIALTLNSYQIKRLVAKIIIPFKTHNRKRLYIVS